MIVHGPQPLYLSLSSWEAHKTQVLDRSPHQNCARHLTGIARLAQPSPMVTIPAGPFLLGSKRVDDDPYGNWTQFDDTELPQHRVWMDTYEMDRDEVSLGEYLAFLRQQKIHPSDELQKLIWHVIYDPLRLGPDPDPVACALCHVGRGERSVRGKEHTASD